MKPPTRTTKNAKWKPTQCWGQYHGDDDEEDEAEEVDGEEEEEGDGLGIQETSTILVATVSRA